MSGRKCGAAAARPAKAQRPRVKEATYLPRELPAGWPVGEIHYTNDSLWSYFADPTEVRQRLFDEYVTASDDLDDWYVRVQWHARQARYVAFAMSPYRAGQAIGVYAGMLRDDCPDFWTRLSPQHHKYVLRLSWRGIPYVLDASEVGSALRFVQRTATQEQANVEVQWRRCKCGIAAPVALPVICAIDTIAEGDQLWLYQQEPLTQATPTVATSIGAETLEPVPYVDEWHRRPEISSVDAASEAGVAIGEVGCTEFAPVDPDKRSSNWIIDLRTGTEMPMPAAESDTYQLQRLYLPSGLLHVVCTNADQVRDSLGRHSPNKMVKISQVTDPGHPCWQSYALVARQAIAMDEIIGNYTGFMMSGTDKCSHGMYCMDLLDMNAGLVIDGTRHSNEMRYINDFHGVASAPNVEFAHLTCTCRQGEAHQHCVIRAVADIKAGEEILVNYGPNYWKNYSKMIELRDHHDGLG